MIYPNLPDRRADATDALQAAFDQSGKTGECVVLSGFYRTSRTLFLHGANVVGVQPINRSMNYGAEHYNIIGNATIHAVHGYPVIVAECHPQSYRAPVLQSLVLVCYHQSNKGQRTVVDTPCIQVKSGVGKSPLVARNLIIDAAGVGILLEANTGQHIFEDIMIKSSRAAGIRTLSNHTVVDSWFRSIYITGLSHPDYTDATKTPVPPTPVGIDGIPASSSFHDRTLIEHCDLGIRTGTVLNQHFADLFIDDVLRSGIEVNDAYTAKDYLKAMTIQRLHMQTGTEAGARAPWLFSGRGPGKPTVAISSAHYSTRGAGTWTDPKIRPAQVQWV